MSVLGLYNYWIVVVLMMIGFYTMISRGNLVKKLIGLGVFQTSAMIMYISISKIEGATAPILLEDAPDVVYSNPVSSVLILTAIVVSVATLAVGLALVVRIHEAYGTVEEDEIHVQDDVM